jgi:hypothetical protein
MTRATERPRGNHASGTGPLGVPAPRQARGALSLSKGASERVGAGPPPPQSGFGEVSPQRVFDSTRAKGDGAKPPGNT